MSTAHKVNESLYPGVGNIPLKGGNNADTLFLGATSESATAPRGSQAALIVSDSAIYIKAGGAAAVPTDDETGGADGVYQPADTYMLYDVDGGDVLHVIAGGGSGIVTIYWMA